MTATTPKIPRITRPAITFGERGSWRMRVRWNATPPGPPIGAISVRDVGAIVISSGRLVASSRRLVASSRYLSRPGVDEDVHDVRQQVGGEHHEGDHDEDALDQRVVQLAERVEQVKPDARIVEDALDQ